MTYPAAIAQVYSSPDCYAATSGTLGSFRPSPSLGQLRVTVGRAPRWLFRARMRLYALDILRGGSLAGWLQGGPDPQFRLPAREFSRAWYTTLVLELPPVRLEAAELGKAVVEHEGVLDEAAVLLAANASANIIAKRELRGLFLQRPDGKWVKYPSFELFAPTIGLGHSEATLRVDLAAAEAAFRSWHVPAIGGTRIDWALKALLADEPWSQFVWLMFSLEQLVEEHHRSNRPTSDQLWRADAEAHVRAAVPDARLNWHKPSITMKFAALATHLSTASGAADTATFHRLESARDSMLHGSESEAPDGAIRQAARELTLRYNALFAISKGATLR